MTEQRGAARTLCDLQIEFTLNESSIISAHILDLSATGMGISTDTKLHKGQMINFVKDQPHWELPEKALVVWSFTNKSGSKAGLEFIAPNC
nr:PilZ domain-containing protein [Desulfobulbaceae bacterium]